MRLREKGRVVPARGRLGAEGDDWADGDGDGDKDWCADDDGDIDREAD